MRKIMKSMNLEGPYYLSYVLIIIIFYGKSILNSSVLYEKFHVAYANLFSNKIENKLENK